ncbi:MAG TPA: oxidoreductase [Ktedonobacteraceae bacterium]|nr:oxidoreductase [Ktedonobacteraceae bacterium]
MPTPFRSFVVNKTGAGFTAQVQQLTIDDLMPGEVLIHVAYSSVNYKDALACIPEGRIVRSYPFVPGIDLSGTVVESSDPRFSEGDKVIITGYDLGVSHYGGFSEYARVKADWIVPLPEGLTLKEAMIFGTAGFEAALALDRLEKMGLKPERGTVLVTGATGGVGSMAISMLAKRGYIIAASTGKQSEHAYLKELGASNILSREEVSAESSRPMEKELWAGSIDSVGGNTLAYILRTTKYGGSVAACGLTGGTALSTTVFPFILRGVNLLGIDSVFCPVDERRDLWQRMATDLKPSRLDNMMNEVTLDELPEVTTSLLKGNVRGRTVVRL